jgi:mitochondrial distribution and morphology protein 34
MFLRLSDFLLSGIIILVFSKQKGLTLVFRNDPVDSVKVSSTFDSIPPIQRFLQREIERLLRDLMREEVPAIIHKLSLEWAMRNQADECLSPASLTNTHSDNPTTTTTSLAASSGQQSQQNYLYSFETDTNDPLRPEFSSKNLEKLKELANAQHTLSPFTASIPQSVFRSSTTLIASLRSNTTMSRRREHTLTHSQSSDIIPPGYKPLTNNNNNTSPPESIYSAQSNDTGLRPQLYNRRQRSSYLRRAHPPKRKIVRLNSRGGDGTVSTGSVSDTASVVHSEGDYFSEPVGYKPVYHGEGGINWATEEVEKFAELPGTAWKEGDNNKKFPRSETFPRSWDGLKSDMDNKWIEEQRFNLPTLKEKASMECKF